MAAIVFYSYERPLQSSQTCKQSSRHFATAIAIRIVFQPLKQKNNGIKNINEVEFSRILENYEAIHEIGKRFGYTKIL